MPWVPDGSVFHCTDHDERFKRGRVCPQCTSGGDEQLAVSADATDLPIVAEYERKFLTIGEKALGMVDGALAAQPSGDDDDGGASGFGTAAKLLDTSIKAFRAGMECARYREDWKSIPMLRKLLADVKRERAQLVADRRAGAEVRH